MLALPLLLGLTPLLALTLLLVLATSCATPDPVDQALAAAPQPNVLLLVIDCLRADHMGIYGYERDTTPRLDSLSRSSVRFDHAISQASWTRPSLPTLLTGLYPSEHGLDAFGVDEKGRSTSPTLAASETTLAEALKARGYATALIGQQYQLSPHFGLDQGFDFYHHSASRAPNIHRRFFQWQSSLEDRPFFAYLHYLEIHWPYCPPESTRGVFDDGSSDLDPCGSWRWLRDAIQTGEIELSEADRRKLEARYDEELLALDGELGKLLGRLKADGLWDDTLIVVTSDHGEEFWEHGSMNHGQSLYQELIGVPLLFKPPAAWQAPVGRAIDTPVEIRQVMATILHATSGVAESEAVGPDRPDSLLPWLLDPSSAADADADEASSAYVVAESPDEIAVRQGHWKLVAARDGSAYELYDLSKDPGETVDLSRRERRRLGELRAHLRDWQTSLRPKPDAAEEAMDEETIEGLRALGYLD